MLFIENFKACGFENKCLGNPIVWLPYKNQPLQQGDIVETPTLIKETSPIFPGKQLGLIKHYGIFFIKDGIGYIAHNPALEAPQITPIADFTKNRKIERVAHSSLTTDYVLKIFDETKHLKYSFSLYNCEDVITSFCGCSPVFDQRLKGIIIFAALIIVFYFILKAR